MIKRELRKEIGKMRIEDRIPIANIVSMYGVSASSVSRWSKEYLRDKTEKNTDADVEVRQLMEENTRLEHEVERLSRELEALRTSLIVLAREKDSR